MSVTQLRGQSAMGHSHTSPGVDTAQSRLALSHDPIRLGAVYNLATDDCVGDVPHLVHRDDIRWSPNFEFAVR